MSSQLAALTPSNIDAQMGRFKINGNYDASGVDPAPIAVGQMDRRDTLTYSVVLIGCNGGRASETGTIYANPGSNGSYGFTVTTGATQRRNLFHHLIKWYAQAVPGRNGRVMLWIVPGQDCPTVQMDPITGRCPLQSSTGRSCQDLNPAYYISISSVGTRPDDGSPTGRHVGQFWPPAQGGAGQPPQFSASAAAPADIISPVTIVGMKSGIFPNDGNADAISLGLMDTNDVVTVDVMLDTCGARGAFTATFVGTPHSRGEARLMEVYITSAKSGNGQIPLMSDLFNFYATVITRGTLQLFMEMEPIPGQQCNSNHKYFSEVKSAKGTFDPDYNSAFNRSDATLLGIRLVGRSNDGRHPWSPADSCQSLYEARGFTSNGWYYILDPSRTTSSVRPAKLVQCIVRAQATSTDPIQVDAFGYVRYIQPTTQSGAQAQCATRLMNGTLAGIRNSYTYNALVLELQASPAFRYWLGLVRNTSATCQGNGACAWAYVSGMQVSHPGSLWAPGEPQNSNNCVAVSISGTQGSQGNQRWAGNDELSLVTAPCDSTNQQSIRGFVCWGRLPTMVGGTGGN